MIHDADSASSLKTDVAAEGTKKVTLNDGMPTRPKSRASPHTTGTRNALGDFDSLPPCSPRASASVCSALVAEVLYQNAITAAPSRATHPNARIPFRHPNACPMELPNGAPITEARDDIAPRIPIVRPRREGGHVRASAVSTQTNAKR